MGEQTESIATLEAPGRSHEELHDAGRSEYAENAQRLVREAVASLRKHAHRYAVGTLTVVFAALYATAGIVEHMAHRTALLDLGIYDQALREYAAFNLPRVPLFGVRAMAHAGLLHWTDHFTPILALLTPLYWVHDGPETLIIAQGVLFALALPAIWLFARRALGATAAYFVAIAFGLSWPIQEAAWIPFHQVAFATPLLALMLERYRAQDYKRAAVLALLLLAVREDMGLLVSTFGLFLLARGSKSLGAALTLGGVSATVLITNVLIPLFGGSPRRNWSYSDFGQSPLEMLEMMLRSPLATLEYALTPAAKVHTLVWLFAPVLFLCLRSRLVLLAVPLLAIRFLSTEPNYWSTKYHYNAFVVSILFCAAIDAARNLPRLKPRWLRWPVATPTLWALATCCFAFMTLPRWPAWKLTRLSWWYPRTSAIRAAEVALARVPSGAFVAAANNLGIHLTDRAKVILWVPPGDRREVEAVWKLDGVNWRYIGDQRLAEAPWVVADIQRAQFPFRSVAAQRLAVQALLDRGFILQHAAEGYLVLHRPTQ
jgi:uncharacterized membrane protein